MVLRFSQNDPKRNIAMIHYHHLVFVNDRFGMPSCQGTINRCRLPTYSPNQNKLLLYPRPWHTEQTDKTVLLRLHASLTFLNAGHCSYPPDRHNPSNTMSKTPQLRPRFLTVRNYTKTELSSYITLIEILQQI
ncbi:hypothetical protein BRADI_1g62175v3 [Brachypodium distachyon]|uniref:Uncharacterized protein n=1 Tax=Brachypodium distachyon TaxID=15368 RepID=A0A2K2DT02_BRADI|nr:hypothetical protein BRADI_1g62175v3 [Brachypodium distachyon]